MSAVSVYRRIWVSFAGVLVLFAGLTSHAMEYGKYTEFAVYSKDGLEASQFGERVIVVFHGFASAMPNGTYKAIHKAMKDTHTVIGFNYDYVDVHGTVTHLDKLRALLDGKHVTVVGTSLGAYWADYYANRYGADNLVMINPVIDPNQYLMSNLGEHFSEKRQKAFVVTEAAASDYAGIVNNFSDSTRRLLILTKHDPYLDPGPSWKKYWNTPSTDLMVYDTDIHTLPLKKHPAMKIIRTFLLTPAE